LGSLHFKPNSQRDDFGRKAVQQRIVKALAVAQAEAVVIEGNVADFVLSKAKTTDKSVSFEELMGQQG